MFIRSLFSTHKDRCKAVFGFERKLMIYRIKSIYRFLLFWALRPFVRFGEYQHESVTCNWLGWYELPVIGCIAFRNSDNRIVYRW